MTNERIPNDPYRSGLSDDNFGRSQRFDRDLQVDPELQEGPASSGRIALFAVGIAVVLGAVFYGLNNTSVKEAQTSPPAQTAQPTNNQPGMTTGSATNRQTPPQSAPKGTEIDRSANPPTDTNDNK